jgi:outer membrane protein assembly factor BamB
VTRAWQNQAVLGGRLRVLMLATLLAGCGGGAVSSASTSSARSSASTPATPPVRRAQAAAALANWPTFGLTAQRSAATSSASGITAANVRNLRRRQVGLPGAVDSAPIYLHGAQVGGGAHDIFVVTTTYGHTLAVDAASGRILWSFQPSADTHLQGSAQFSTATPVVDPSGKYVYAPSPDGRVYKLAVADGRPAGGGWPVRVTLDPTHEKLSGALNIDGADLIVVTGGYYGDAPSYQGHVVAIDRASGRITAVFNALCSNRHALITPSSCSGSDAAIWGRAGSVVEPDGRILVATGNGPYNGTTNFGDSVLELDWPSLRLRQAYTPSDQSQLDSSDLDLGSSAPVLVSSGLVLEGGKDSILRLLSLGRLDGAAPGSRRLGGELQELPTPASQQLFTAPAVWQQAGATTVFVADGGGTAAYRVQGQRLVRSWSNGTGGTSPVLAGGLLYVYDPGGGGLHVYAAGSGRPLAVLPAGSGHFNSPAVADGFVALGEGNGMDHPSSGVLDIYSLR